MIAAPNTAPLTARAQPHISISRSSRESTMSWLTNYVLPKIRALTRKDVPENLWKKCPGCDQMLFHRELAANFEVCRNCGHHFRLGATDRFKMLFDRGVFERVELAKVPADPLRFRDRKRYTDRLKESQSALGAGSEAIAVAYGEIGGTPAVVAAFEFGFMGGSMGVAVGEAFVTAARLAVERSLIDKRFTSTICCRSLKPNLPRASRTRSVSATEPSLRRHC